MWAIMHSYYPFDQPGVYEIHVIGKLNERWLEQLGGMTIIVRRSDKSGDWITVLRGWFPDQAALNGVLNALYDRRITLRYVSMITEEDSPTLTQLR